MKRILVLISLILALVSGSLAQEIVNKGFHTESCIWQEAGMTMFACV
jgi:hypothetical protein